MKQVIRVFEHEKLIIGEEREGVTFTNAHHNAFIRLGGSFEKTIFTVVHQGIKFSHYVGVIRIPGLAVEIFPKADRHTDGNYFLWRKVLIEMLMACRFLKINTTSVARLTGKPGTLLDLYISSFLEETENLIRQGFIKQYRQREGYRSSLQGRMLFTAHSSQTQVHKEKIYCRYQSFDFNHVFNKILVKGLQSVSFYAADLKLRDKAVYLLSFLTHIEDIKINAGLFSRLRYNRQTRRYQKAMELAAILLLNHTYGIQHGSQPAIAILFDMNKLFEEFVYRQLKKLEEKYEIKVNWQVPAAFWANHKIRPDIIVSWEKDSKRCVIDTKWKILRSVEPSMDDLRQMYVYNQYFNTSSGLLLYPKVYPLSPKMGTYQTPNAATDMKENYCQINFVKVLDESKQKINPNMGDEIIEMIMKV